MNREPPPPQTEPDPAAPADLPRLLAEAVASHQAGRLPEAEQGYRRILAIDPRHADALHLLGMIAHHVGRHDAAADLIGQAIAIDGSAAVYPSNLATVFKAMGRLEDAVAASDAALRLKPDYLEALINLAGTLADLERFEEAIAAGRAALRLQPDHAEALFNLGLACNGLGRSEEAIAALEAALRLKPDYAEAHCARAHAHFHRGDLAAAWPDYEWRLRGDSKAPKRSRFRRPQWAGEDLAGRTILLHHEQGVGDTIQFCRYAALVAERGGRVILETPPPVMRLLSGLAGVDQPVAMGDPLPDFDYHCALISLPSVFRTAIETIPATIPYLGTEDEAVERWRARIGPNGFRIGIAWQGNPNAPAERGRSAPLAAFAPLAAIPGVRLISLQKMYGLEQLDDLPPGMIVETLGEDFDSGPDAFVDTAAALMSLDLVVTVDTAVGHVAGALGRPIWLALQKAPHWVWMGGREDSPWYPAHRLFRQVERGDWAAVFGRMADALESLIEAGLETSADLVDPQKLFVEALAHHQAGDLPLAEQGYRQVLATAPRHADALHLLGVIATQVGRNDAAVDLIAQAIQADATVAAYHSNLGTALATLDRFEEAAAAYQAALRIEPDQATVHGNLGNALTVLGRPQEAVLALQEAIRLKPDHAAAHNDLAAAFTHLERLDEALAACDAALRLKPDYAEAHYNRGVVLEAQARIEDAADAYRTTADLDPGHVEARYNLGGMLMALGRLDAAAEAWRTAVALDPSHAKAQFNLGLPRLLQGDLAAAWPSYEWRWRIPGAKPRDVSQPQWAGEDIAGRTILLHAEQGAGDTILFCRYAALVAARGAKVVLEAPRPLLRLLSPLPGVDQLVAQGDALSDFDVHCPLMSLPGVFGTTLETIPADIPYLRAENELVHKWRERIGPEGFKIGIAWQGNPDAPAERGRSAPLAAFAPLAGIPGVRLISLQKGYGLEQLDHLPPGMTVETLGDDFDSGPDAFVDTAAAITALDLVVTVDTAIGHLAGAMGRPVWLALQQIPYWVWMMDRQDSPWHPAHRLFRQSERGDWDGVFARIEQALRRRIAPTSPRR